MTWFLSNVSLPPHFVEAWLQLFIVLAVGAFLVRMRRFAASCVVIALAPLLLPFFPGLAKELWSVLTQYFPWYVLAIAGFFLAFILLRGLIAAFMGGEIADRTTSDLLTMTIAGIVRACVAVMRGIVQGVLIVLRRGP